MIKEIFRKAISGLTAALMTISFSGMSVSADQIPVITGDKAVLEYDSNTDRIVILNADGEQFSTDFYTERPYKYDEVTDDSRTTETTTVAAATETSVPVTTTVNTTASAAVTTTVVTFSGTASPASTVSGYTGRYRVSALSEKISSMNAYTTVTTTTTTAATKKVYDGIDVSRWQGDIDWGKVKKAGIDFVMIRAGFGMEDDHVDRKFHENIKGAQAAGIDCGVYWYSYALSTKDALKEAKACLSTIKGYKLTYPVAFDIEDPSQKSLTMTQISDITKTFCSYLEENRYYVSVYSYASMLKDKMNSSVLSKYDIWVAHTGVDKPSFSGNYGMWQYSWKGRVNGISGDVDLDYGYVYYPEIIKKNKLNGY